MPAFNQGIHQENGVWVDGDGNPLGQQGTGGPPGVAPQQGPDQGAVPPPDAGAAPQPDQLPAAPDEAPRRSRGHGSLAAGAPGDISLKGEKYTMDGAWYVKQWVIDKYGSADDAPPEVVEANRVPLAQGLIAARHEKGQAYRQNTWDPAAQQLGFKDWKQAYQAALARMDALGTSDADRAYYHNAGPGIWAKYLGIQPGGAPAATPTDPNARPALPPAPVTNRPPQPAGPIFSNATRPQPVVATDPYTAGPAQTRPPVPLGPPQLPPAPAPTTKPFKMGTGGVTAPQSMQFPQSKPKLSGIF